MKKRVENLLQRVSLECLGKGFDIRIEYDKKYEILTAGREDDERLARVYLQIGYWSKCTKTQEEDFWKGRKWYLSEHMTDDEIIKTCYSAFKAAVEHEVMEGFKVDGVIVFNPHLNFEELLKISHKEVRREHVQTQ